MCASGKPHWKGRRFRWKRETRCKSCEHLRHMSHSLGRHVGDRHEEVSGYGAVLPCLVYYVAFMLSKRSCTAQIESIIYF